MVINHFKTKLRDKQVEKWWNRIRKMSFGVDENNEYYTKEDIILHNNRNKLVKVFPKGTSAKHVWDWFDSQHSLGFEYLVYGEL